MRQPELTKAKVLSEAITLFNTKGYKSTSLSDITKATGFTKGAIYRHFESKEDLEIEAFEKMMYGIFNIMKTKIKEEKTTKDKLFSVLNLFQSYINNPIFVGGCPLLNISIEMDDTNFELKNKAMFAMQILRESLETLIVNGKNKLQVKTNVNQQEVTTIIIAALEGGIMMSKLQSNNIDINRVVVFLKKYIEIEILN